MDLFGNPSLAALIVAVLGAATLAAVGALATELGPWYYALKQPSWKPADVWFGPVWTTIFALGAWAALRAWAGAGEDEPRRWLLVAFAFNGLLNVLWSLIFFRLRRPDWALVEVVALWLSVALLMALCAAHDKWSAALLLPYLVWVGFAAWLNLAVVRLNGPF